LDTRTLGTLAERVAACFLAMKGYSVLAAGYRFHGKELDLVVERDGRIVFVEVKFRRTERCGLPREAVDARKRRRIIFAARGFLAERGLHERRCRFDVVEVTVDDAGRELVVRHIAGAFGVDW
jgi:putative endonuclease